MVLDELETRSVLAEHEHLAVACTFWQRPGFFSLYGAFKTFPLAPHFESLDVTIQGGKRERPPCRRVRPQGLALPGIARRSSSSSELRLIANKTLLFRGQPVLRLQEVLVELVLWRAGLRLPVVLPANQWRQ